MDTVDLNAILSKALDSRRLGRLNDHEKELVKGLKQAKKLNEFLFYHKFATVLHSYLLLYKQDKRQSKKVEKEIDLAMGLIHAQEVCRHAYANTAYLVNRNRKLNKPQSALLEQYSRQVERFISFRNPKISIYGYQVLIAEAYANGSLQEVIIICKDAINLFEEKETGKLPHFYADIVPALVGLQQYKEAISMCSKGKQIIKGRRYTWSVLAYYKLTALLHSRKYKRAYTEFVGLEKSKVINPAMNEQKAIVKGFFKVLHNSGLVQGVKSFRLSKVLNEVPIFDKDKYGNFINILILKIIIGTQENKLKLIEEAEAITKAYQRYCDKGTREQIFLRMLLRIPAKGFHRSLIEPACAADLKKLSNLPQSARNLDIVPYIDLWAIILNGLKQ